MLCSVMLFLIKNASENTTCHVGEECLSSARVYFNDLSYYVDDTENIKPCVKMSVVLAVDYLVFAAQQDKSVAYAAKWRRTGNKC